MGPQMDIFLFQPKKLVLFQVASLSEDKVTSVTVIKVHIHSPGRADELKYEIPKSLFYIYIFIFLFTFDTSFKPLTMWGPIKMSQTAQKHIYDARLCFVISLGSGPTAICSHPPLPPPLHHHKLWSTLKDTMLREKKERGSLLHGGQAVHLVPCYTLQLRCHLVQVITENTLETLFYVRLQISSIWEMQKCYRAFFLSSLFPVGMMKMLHSGELRMVCY